MNKIAILVFLGLAVNAALAVVPLLAVESKSAVPGQYLVIFRNDTTKEQRAAHTINLLKSINGDSEQEILHVWNIEDFHGFAARLSDAKLAEQRTFDDVIDYIENDQEVHVAACASQSTADWGLDRTDQKTVNLDGNFRYTSTGGAGVNSYIVDTGINIAHTDFGGRAKWGANYADTTNSDCNGHGTHVAGTVGGKTYGIAKSTTLIAVKVLNCAGSGTNAGVISGINYVADQYKATRKTSVANMSLGGGYSAALNNAVAAAISAGVTFVVAAGNENQDACNTSPASTPSAVTVGATTIDAISGVDKDVRASFSNYGTCVTIMAPGELIRSAWIGSNTATKTISGTSMASPHVCGVAALYLDSNPSATPAQVKSALISSATAGVVNMACTGTACNATPNRMLYHACV
jgi:subtilisin family serine protease